MQDVRLSKPVWTFLWLLSVAYAFMVGYEWGWTRLLDKWSGFCR